MGWLIALLVLVILAILPLGASIIYDAGGPLVRVLIGPFALKVYPVKKKDKPKTEKKTEKKKQPQEKPAEEKKNPEEYIDNASLDALLNAASGEIK